MALALNTSHPLYANLVGLIAVDDDNVIKDLKNVGTTCTPDAAVTLGSGTYGRHFRTTVVSNNSKGVALSAVIPFGTTAVPNGTVVAVLNSVQSVSPATRNSLVTNSAAASSMPTICLNATKQVGIASATAIPAAFTTGNIATGANMVTVTRTGQTASQVIINANDETYNGGQVAYNNATNGINYIGGFASGGYGAVSADFVWVAFFDKILNPTEIADLHASLGASNAFDLIVSGDGSGTGTPSSLSLLAPSATGNGTGGSTNGSGSGTPSVISVTGVTATGNGTNAGVITTPALKNNTGTVLASISGWTVNVYNDTTGVLVVQKTGLTTSAGGVLTITDAAITASSSYSYEPVHATYGRRLPIGTST